MHGSLERSCVHTVEGRRARHADVLPERGHRAAKAREPFGRVQKSGQADQRIGRALARTHGKTQRSARPGRIPNYSLRAGETAARLAAPVPLYYGRGMSQSALERAREHCFLAGVGDAGEGLCAANMPFGIAKIHHVQRELGLPEDASFIGAPDATITRNLARWNHGFGYGGRIQWTGDFAVLDIKSNHCGMIAVALEDPPPPDEIRERGRKLQKEPLVVEGIEVDFDLSEGNHFLDICEVRETYGDNAPIAKTYAIIHSSGHEHRERSPKGPGIYWDHSEELARMMETRDTPWGPLHILRGDAAKHFYEAYSFCQTWSLQRREALARAMLGPLNVVCNRTHQGLQSMNDAILGCYCFDDDDLSRGQLFPLTLAPDLPAYLVAPTPNFDDRALSDTGFGDRAERHGLVERLRRANLLPHGGGYSFAEYSRVRGVIESGGERSFELEKVGGGSEVMTDVRNAAYGYRGDEVRQRMLDLRLGRPRVKTEITYILRT